MFGLGSIYSTIIMQRIPTTGARNRMHRSVWFTNVAVVVLVGALCFAGLNSRADASEKLLSRFPISVGAFHRNN